MFKHCISLLLGSLFLMQQASVAQNFEEYIPVESEVYKAWFVIVDGDQSRAFPTAFDIIGGEAVIQGYLGGLSEHALVGATVLLESGEMISSRLNSPWRRELPIETGREKISEERRLTGSIRGQLARIKELEGELHLVTLEKRREAGLDEVDRLYERIAQTELDIDQAKKILQSR